MPRFGAFRKFFARFGRKREQHVSVVPRAEDLPRELRFSLQRFMPRIEAIRPHNREKIYCTAQAIVELIAAKQPMLLRGDIQRVQNNIRIISELVFEKGIPDNVLMQQLASKEIDSLDRLAEFVLRAKGLK